MTIDMVGCIDADLKVVLLTSVSGSHNSISARFPSVEVVEWQKHRQLMPTVQCVSVMLLVACD